MYIWSSPGAYLMFNDGVLDQGKRIGNQDHVDTRKEIDLSFLKKSKTHRKATYSINRVFQRSSSLEKAYIALQVCSSCRNAAASRLSRT